ncbi:hypothetical protein SAL_1691 [Streptococcus agalactiae 515]|nr:hypothetical protein SAL_1691 [Streptococcus agalactiae 515]
MMMLDNSFEFLETWMVNKVTDQIHEVLIVLILFHYNHPSGDIITYELKLS